MTAKTLIILNPHAAGGRAGRLWTKLEPLLWQHLGELVVAVTQRPQEVAEHLDKAHASGLTRVIAVGGDGTNHALVNALVDFNLRQPGETPMIYGNLPIGTGRDWARGLGMPFHSLDAAARWIAHAQPQPTDIGLLTADQQQEYFLNVASAGLSGDVVRRVNARPRRPWSYLLAAVEGVLQLAPPPLRVLLDGAPWYEGTSYMVAIANGTTFGNGMKIAPGARIRDGLFDVVLVEGASRPAILTALWQVYTGSHLRHPNVRFARAARVDIRSETDVIGMEFDGEVTGGRELTFEVKPGLLQMLG